MTEAQGLSGRSSAETARARWVRILLLVSILTALVTAVLALALPSSSSASTWVFRAHVGFAALLGLLILVSFLLAFTVRTAFPKGWVWAGLALLLVVIMGGIGQGFEAGTLPSVFLYVQTGLVAVLMGLLFVAHQQLTPTAGSRRRAPSSRP